MKVFLTVPPAVELVLQPGDGVPQGLVLLLLSLILLLPLFCCQLNIHSDSVLDGLCSERGEKYDNLDKRDIILLTNKTITLREIRQRSAVSFPLPAYKPLSKHEGGFGFSVIVGGRRAADDNGGSTVTTQRVLQNTGHLAVSVGDVGLAQADTDKQKKKILIS